MSIEVRFYRATVERVGPVTLTAYRLFRREPLKLAALSSGDAVDKLYDILVNVVERYRNDPEAVLVEVLARTKGGEIGAATLTRQGASQRGLVPLFHRPARLRRIGVKRGQKVEWHPVGEELYVFQGRLELPEDVDAVLVDTEYGLRIVTREEINMLIEEQRQATRQQQGRRKRRSR